jgi:hypothetical protein
MVSDDVVVGVVINGQARAYPIHVLNVHEIINDTLGDPPVPIAVTYSWPGDAVRVFDRRVDGRILEFGVSGMLYNANVLMFDVRRDDAGKPIVGGESLWLQLQSECVAGPDAGKTLNVVPAQMVRWSDWLEAHPESTIVDRDLRLDKRYKDGSPTLYFLDSKFPFPFSPKAPPSAVDPKDRIIAVQANGQRRVYPLAIISARATNGTFEDELGGVRIIFHPHREKQTVYLTTDPPDADVQWYPERSGEIRTLGRTDVGTPWLTDRRPGTWSRETRGYPQSHLHGPDPTPSSRRTAPPGRRPPHG